MRREERRGEERMCYLNGSLNSMHISLIDEIYSRALHARSLLRIRLRILSLPLSP